MSCLNTKDRIAKIYIRQNDVSDYFPATTPLLRDKVGAHFLYPSKLYKMGRKNQHVVPHGNQWAIKGAGNSKNTLITSTQSEAINVARTIAQNHGSELFIHNRQGQIRERNTYGPDPNPPKG